MVAVFYTVMHMLIDSEIVPTLQMWMNARIERTRSCPVTTIATTTSAATTAPAVSATSCTQTTEPVEVGPRDGSVPV